MKFEYMSVSYKQVRRGTGYVFYSDYDQDEIKLDDDLNIIPVLDFFGKSGWQFICRDSGKLIFKRSY